MKRVVIGFLLLLFVFVSGGYTQLYAHSLEAATSSQIARQSLPTDKIQHVVDVTIEEEDDDNTSSKKYIDNGPFTILLYSDSSNDQALAFRRPLLHTSPSPTYILFRVFRV